MEAIGKMFAGHFQTPQSDPVDQIEFYSSNHLTILFYDYKKSNSYLTVLNTGFQKGLHQIIFTPYKFSKIAEKLHELKYKLKKIEFDPPLEDETILESIQHSMVNNEFKNFYQEVLYLNEEYDTIPKKLSFLSSSGNRYSIFNNGIISIEERNEIEEINPFLDSLVGDLL